MTALLTALFLGIVVGSIYSLSAFGLVLTYRASGVFNFAHGAVGMVSAFAFYQLVQGGRVDLVFGTYEQTWKLPRSVAFVLVVGALAPGAGWILDRVLFRRLRDAGEVVKIVVTIGLLVALQGIAGIMWGAATTLSPTRIFSRKVFVLGGFRASGEEFAAILVTGALAVGLLLFLRYSAVGIRMRAVVDRPEMAELAGVDSGLVSGASWAIGTGFAAISGILIVPFFGSIDPITLTFFVVPATAAAVAGRLYSFPLTLAGGYGIGMAQMIVQRYASSELASQLRPSIPFVVLFGLLFLPQWRKRPTDRFTPPPLPPLGRALTARWATIVPASLSVAAVLLPFALDPRWQLHIARVPSLALIFLSLVVVTGYGGQVSLCQAALAGFGAFVTAHLVSGFGFPFWVAVLAGGLSVVPIGVFLSLRAANLSPLFLGLATLAFGAVMDEVVFSSRRFSGGLSGVFFERPGYLRSPRSYYFATVAIFALGALAVSNLRRSKTGLALQAMRDSEVGLGSLGIDVARLKLVAFSMSALIAGIGGALYSAADDLATPFSYFKFQSLLFLTLAVIGGIGSWSGALMGAVIFQLVPPFVHEPFISRNPIAHFVFREKLVALLPVFFGLGAIGLARNTHGLAEQLRSLFAGRPEPALPPPEPARLPVEAAPAGGVITFAEAGFYHRPDCLLAAGKEGRSPASGEVLRPCPVCEP